MEVDDKDVEETDNDINKNKKEDVVPPKDCSLQEVIENLDIGGESTEEGEIKQ